MTSDLLLFVLLLFVLLLFVLLLFVLLLFVLLLFVRIAAVAWPFIRTVDLILHDTSRASICSATSGTAHRAHR
jgi:hypothetical protein